VLHSLLNGKQGPLRQPSLPNEFGRLVELNTIEAVLRLEMGRAGGQPHLSSPASHGGSIRHITGVVSDRLSKQLEGGRGNHGPNKPNSRNRLPKFGYGLGAHDRILTPRQGHRHDARDEKTGRALRGNSLESARPDFGAPESTFVDSKVLFPARLFLREAVLNPKSPNRARHCGRRQDDPGSRGDKIMGESNDKGFCHAAPLR
jgi:hypothetical protein